jgi:hypothetical protein
MVIVEFEKILKRGILNGLTVVDKLRFPSRKEASWWIRDVKQFDKGATYVRFDVKDAI